MGSLTVEPLDGVWVAKFKDMARAIEEEQVYLHEYENRLNDDKNAKNNLIYSEIKNRFEILIL